MENKKIKLNDEKPRAIISPSFLSCDFTILYEECKTLIENGADQLHVDIMVTKLYYQNYIFIGWVLFIIWQQKIIFRHFVPNLSFGPQIVKFLKKRLPTTFLDCHLMVTYPKKWIVPFAQAGADQYTFHLEADFEGTIEEVIKMIKDNKMKVGLALNPKTQITKEVEQLIEKDQIDTILIMTVYPGFGGQKFIEEEVYKAKSLRKKFPNLNIEADGGIGLENIEVVAKNGINNIVSGTGIIWQKDQKATMKEMRQFLENEL